MWKMKETEKKNVLPVLDYLVSYIENDIAVYTTQMKIIYKKKKKLCITQAPTDSISALLPVL